MKTGDGFIELLPGFDYKPDVRLPLLSTEREHAGNVNREAA